MAPQLAGVHLASVLVRASPAGVTKVRCEPGGSGLATASSCIILKK